MIDWSSKKVLVTGGTGFIGSYLVPRLLKLGADVSLFVLDEERKLPEVLPLFRGNIQDFPDVQRAVGRFQPDYVFHLAAQPIVDIARISVYDTLDTNIRGTINFLQSCVEVAKNVSGIIFVTTDKVYGEFDGTIDESAPLLGVGHPYDASKVCADVLAQMYAKVYGLPIMIARSGNIYGKEDYHWDRLIPGTILSALKHTNPVIRSNGKFTRDYIYADDIIDGYLLLANAITDKPSHRGDAVNFGAEKPHTVLDIVHSILEVSGAIDLVPEIQNISKNEIPHQHLNWDYAKELGWSPKTDLASGLAITYAWYKQYYEEMKKK